MNEPNRPTETPSERAPDREGIDGPHLDRAGGVDRQELNPRRSGEAPVEQNDRTRDRQLEETSEP